MGQEDSTKLAVVEHKVKTIETALEDMRTIHDDMNKKLDSLLTLKHKGAGAFWLASIIFGTSILGVIGYFVDLFKH